MLNPDKFEKVYYYKNVVEDPISLINLIEKSDEKLTEKTSIPKWKKWTASGWLPEESLSQKDDLYTYGYQKRFSNEVDLDTDEDIKYINSILKQAISEASNHYAEDNGINIGQLAPISISKYFTGKSMGPHVDDYDNGDDPNISVVLYLNDDYEGGEINFPEQNITIKPEAGSIVIFPSVKPYYHQSLPVISGIKYMSPGFWRKVR